MCFLSDIRPSHQLTQEQPYYHPPASQLPKTRGWTGYAKFPLGENGDVWWIPVHYKYLLSACVLNYTKPYVHASLAVFLIFSWFLWTFGFCLDPDVCSSPDPFWFLTLILESCFPVFLIRNFLNPHLHPSFLTGGNTKYSGYWRW